jgi:integral membrane protein
MLQVHPMTALRQFRIAALLEGWSYLVLLLIAMPKYAAGLPLAVRIVGSVHGFLFLTFLVARYRVILDRNWPIRRALRGFPYSLIPFGAAYLTRAALPQPKFPSPGFERSEPFPLPSSQRA